MKWKQITIKDESIKEAVKKLKISERSFGKIADIDVATTHKALNEELILSEKTAQKMIKALKYLQKSPKICEKLQEITKRSGGNSELTKEERKIRNNKIVDLRAKGKTLAEVGKEYNLSKQRIQQICLDKEVESLRQ